ncbi:isocitrate lyase/phosphoenolpyruvate mutase family protein [Mycobacterium sp. HNNTM2301]|uniref:isocitrate lyase/PEP mutase family protein n=1 Tax=Mycobacterium hainanense TaxID=3289775 RepID=UPI0035A5D9AF
MSFHDLHHHNVPFVLPNAWDVPSALSYLEDGFTAVGTTSFGLSSSGGHADGGRATRDANIALAAALAPLGCYVSVDVEDGYSDDPDEVADYVAALPLAGINIEDSTDSHLVDPDAAAAKVAAIKRRCPDVFINARVDTYWLNQDATPAATIKRAQRYIAAGADGIFVPLANDRTELAEITAAISCPVNTLPIPGLSLAQLGELGVARVSTGSMPYSASLFAAAQAARAIRDDTLPPHSLPYPRLQARLVDYEKHAHTPQPAT